MWLTYLGKSSLAALAVTACGGRSTLEIGSDTRGAALDTVATGGAYNSSGTHNSSGPNNSGGMYNPGGASTVLAPTGGRATGGSSSTNPSTSYCNGMFDEKICGVITSQASIHVPNILLVLDASLRMRNHPSAAEASTMWQLLGGAFSTTLLPAADLINFGLEFYPYSGALLAPNIDPQSTDVAMQCSVPHTSGPNTAIAAEVAPGADHLSNIIDIMKGVAPAGSRPTEQALYQAYDYFTRGNGKALPGTRWIILITSGGPNCSSTTSRCDASACTMNIDCSCGSCDTTYNCCALNSSTDSRYLCLNDTATIAQLQQLANVGVGTFVIGLPGSEPYATTLSGMAQAGQMPNLDGGNGESYYAVSASNSRQELEDTLRTITTLLLSPCDIRLENSPPDPYAVMVAIGCALVPIVPPSTPVTGSLSGLYIDYTYEPAHLKLTGTYCEGARANPAEDILVIPGCADGIN